MTERAALTMIILVPLVVALSCAFVVPRSYAVQDTDLENDYYYNAKLLISGQSPQGLHHPGTPIQMLFALVMKVVGSEIEKTQIYFNVLYVLIGIVNTVALATFYWLTRKSIEPVYLVIFSAFVLSWPPYLIHLNYAGSDSFVVALALIPLALFWRIVAENRVASRQEVVILGLLLGFGCAVKFTILPFAVALWLSLLPGLFMRREEGKIGLILALPLCALGSFVLFTLPLISQYVELGRYFILDVLFKAENGNLEEQMSSIASTLLQDNPILFGLCILTVLFFPIAIFFSRKVRHERIDVTTGGIFILLGFFMLIQNSVSSVFALSDPFDLSIGLRYLMPVYLVLPFALWYEITILKRLRIFASLDKIIATIAILSLVVGLLYLFLSRAHFLNELTRNASYVENIFNTRMSEGKIAFWSSGNPHVFMEPSFHFWGSHYYAVDYFNDEVAKAFPLYSFLHYRTALGILRAQSSQPPSDAGFFRNVYRRLSQREPLRRKFADELFTGNTVPAVILIPYYEVPPQDFPEDVLTLITERTGVIYEKEIVDVGGEPWLILTSLTEDTMPSPKR